MYRICFSQPTKRHSSILDNVMVEDEEGLGKEIYRLENYQGATVHGWVQGKDGKFSYSIYEGNNGAKDTH